MFEGATLFLAVMIGLFAINALRTEDRHRRIKALLEAQGATEIEVLHRLFTFSRRTQLDLEYTDSSGARQYVSCQID
jgi:hypothetical protein